MGKGFLCPGRAGTHSLRQLGPSLFLVGWHWGLRAPQVCSSIPPTPHTKFRQERLLLVRGEVICYLVAPLLLGSTAASMVSEYK